MISIPDGTMPEAMMSETACPVDSTESKTAMKARALSGLRRMRTVASVMMPSSPSDPVMRASRS